VSGLVLFDLDNTLVNRERAFLLWAQQFLAERNLDATDLDWVVAVDADGKQSRAAFFQALRARFGFGDSDEALIAAYLKDVQAFYEPEPPTLDALEALRYAGWKLAVVTNGPATQMDKIRAAGLDKVLDAWCMSGVIGVAKPEKAVFEEAARRCGVPLDGGWMVGDTPEIDILGGKRAGMRTAWMARKRTWSITEYAPDLVASDIAEVSKRILNP